MDPPPEQAVTSSRMTDALIYSTPKHCRRHGRLERIFSIKSGQDAQGFYKEVHTFFRNVRTRLSTDPLEIVPLHNPRFPNERDVKLKRGSVDLISFDRGNWRLFLVADCKWPSVRPSRCNEGRADRGA